MTESNDGVSARAGAALNALDTGLQFVFQQGQFFNVPLLGVPLVMHVRVDGCVDGNVQADRGNSVSQAEKERVKASLVCRRRFSRCRGEHWGSVRCVRTQAFPLRRKVEMVPYLRRRDFMGRMSLPKGKFC